MRARRIASYRYAWRSEVAAMFVIVRACRQVHRVVRAYERVRARATVCSNQREQKPSIEAAQRERQSG